MKKTTNTTPPPASKKQRLIPIANNNESKRAEQHHGDENSERAVSKPEHELSKRARANKGRDKPKQVGKRAGGDDSAKTDPTTDAREPRRLMPTRANNKSKRPKLRNEDEDSD